MTNRSCLYIIVGGCWMRQGATPVGVDIESLSASLQPLPFELFDADGEPIPDGHLVVEFADGDAHDAEAGRIAEAFGAAVSLIYGVASEDGPSPIRIANPGAAAVTIEELAASAWSVVHDRPLDWADLRMELGTHWGIPLEIYQIALDLVPMIVTDPYFRAAMLYQASEMSFYVSPGDLGVVLADETRRPQRGADRARFESALTNAFKAVEALIGEPPNDERRLRSAIQRIGLDPDEVVGFQIPGGISTKQPIAKKLAGFQTARDRRGAHAARPGELAPTYVELTDLQRLARLIVLVAVQGALGRHRGAMYV